MLTLGYLVFARSFAYLAIPGTSLYLGEICLAVFLVFGPWNLRALPSRRLTTWLIASLLYGMLQAARGILLGYPALTAMRDVAFNYYAMFLFLGVVARWIDPALLRRMVIRLAWLNACYGVAFLLILNRLELQMFGISEAISVPLFSRPGGSAVAIFALLSFAPNRLSVWPLIALNTFVTLGGLLRGEWVGFGAGLAAWLWSTRSSGRAALALIPALSLLVMMYAADVSIPAPVERAGRISVNHVIARVVAPLSTEAAAELDNYDDAVGAAATAAWRLNLWHAIWQTVHQGPATALFGLGYGYPIGELDWGLMRFDAFLQSPHNDLLYALAYSGWIGVILFVGFQLELGSLLLKYSRSSGQSFGFVCWVAVLSGSLFGSFFESPYAAIPFYLITGMVLGQDPYPALAAGVAPVPDSFPQPLKHRIDEEQARIAPGL